MEEKAEVTGMETAEATEKETAEATKSETAVVTEKETAGAGKNENTEKKNAAVKEDDKRRAIETEKKKELAGFIVSIVGAALSLWGGILGLGCSITGLILSVLSGKKLRAYGEPAGKATAGMVVGIIATVVAGITFLSCMLCAFCGAGLAGGLEALL